MAGSAIIRALNCCGFDNVITRQHSELDLCCQQQLRDFMQSQRPDFVVLAAAKVGGIYANNSYPAEFIYQNLIIEANTIHQAYAAGCQQLLFLGSSCIYPRMASQPMAENALLQGDLEATNEPYAIAKIAGIKMCESYNRQYATDYRCVMPTNLYGPGDNYHPQNSHVIPGLLHRFHLAKINNQPEVAVWGSGRVRREFLFIDDFASACVHLMQTTKHDYSRHIQPTVSHINIGTGTDITIKELAQTIAKVTNYQGKIVWQADKPDGTPQKLLDISRLQATGWHGNNTPLAEGLKISYQWYEDNQDRIRC